MYGRIVCNVAPIFNSSQLFLARHWSHNFTFFLTYLHIIPSRLQQSQKSQAGLPLYVIPELLVFFIRWQRLPIYPIWVGPTLSDESCRLC